MMYTYKSFKVIVKTTVQTNNKEDCISGWMSKMASGMGVVMGDGKELLLTSEGLNHRFYTLY